jgi:hypothetical protein
VREGAGAARGEPQSIAVDDLHFSRFYRITPSWNTPYHAHLLPPERDQVHPVIPEPIDVLRIIQAAVAPVVLISGVGLLLLTLSARLGRIVDRTRIVAAERRTATPTQRDRLDTQISILEHRARLIRLALALSATSVGVIGVLIAVLFLGLLLGWNVTIVCTLLFVTALLCLVIAMFVFVRELFQSLTALKLSVHSAPD